MIDITKCARCVRLPQKDRSSSRRPEIQAFERVADDVLRCPDCGTCYLFDEEHDPGEPMVMASDTYTLIRLTPVLAQARVNGPATGPEAIHGEIMRALREEELPPIPVLKYLVESASDYFLETNDRPGFIERLLRHRSPLVATDAAADLLFIATEEHPVWTVRSYSPHQQALAAEWVKDATLRAEMLEALGRGLQAGLTVFSLDATRRAMEVQARERAYYGIGNALHRGWRVDSIRSDLERLLGAGDESSRLMARNLLQDLRTPPGQG